jgi:hypothetical protein
MIDHNFIENRVRFDFVPKGSFITETISKNHIYLDVGNRLGYGIIDHHQLPFREDARSAASLLSRNQNFLDKAKEEAQHGKNEILILLHSDPDLDCFVSTYFALCYLTGVEISEQFLKMVRYTDGVDQGCIGLDMDHKYNLYSACMMLVHELSQKKFEESDRGRKKRWSSLVRRSLNVIDYVYSQLLARDCEVNDVDAYDCPEEFASYHRSILDQDEKRYLFKLLDEKSQVKVHRKFSLPHEFSGKKQVPALFIRNVQDSQDPERVIFFKDWARGDKKNSGNDSGFVALCASGRDQTRRYTIISIKPDSQCSLEGLGKILEGEEVTQRKKQSGSDNRLVDGETGQLREVRIGYDNPDPWYDGRSHHYTIVDSPRSGTILSPDMVEEKFRFFSGSYSSTEKPLPPFTKFSASVEEKEEDIRRLSLATSWLTAKTERQSSIKQNKQQYTIFISYAHVHIDWVRENLLIPLKTRFSEQEIFFDKESIRIQEDWLLQLVGGFRNCDVFISVFCEKYFQSPYCTWEFTNAFVRSKQRSQSHILPIIIEPTDQGDALTLDIQNPLADIAKDKIKDCIADTIASILGTLKGKEREDGKVSV